LNARQLGLQPSALPG